MVYKMLNSNSRASTDLIVQMYGGRLNLFGY